MSGADTHSELRNQATVITLRLDDWMQLCRVMRSLTWGKDCSGDWWQLHERVVSRNKTIPVVAIPDTETIDT